jgi:hypothetical protein
MLTIVWDIDDVLNDLMLTWFIDEWQPTHPECKLSYGDIKENPPDRVLGVTRAAYLASLDAYRSSDRARNMKPNAAVLEWLRGCGHRSRHMALTARPLDSIPFLAEWLFRHFGTYLRSFGAVPSRLAPSAPVYDRDKCDFLRWFGKADLLIDDSEENIRAAESLGIRSILYPQPWNGCSRTVAETLQSLSDLTAEAI